MSLISQQSENCLFQKEMESSLVKYPALDLTSLVQ